MFTSNWATAWQNQQNNLCAQQRLKSAWASAQSDQSLLSAWRNLGFLVTQWAHSEDSDQTGRRLIWSESSLGVHVILLVLSWCGSIYFDWISYKRIICDLYTFIDQDRSQFTCPHIFFTQWEDKNIFHSIPVQSSPVHSDPFHSIPFHILHNAHSMLDWHSILKLSFL